MPTLKIKSGEIKVPQRLIVRMAERLYKLGTPTRRGDYIERARKRLEGYHPRKNDAAAVLAAGG